MRKVVILDHDGHVDDLLSSLLLWLSPEIDLQAVAVTNGDCYAEQSFAALLKMATYLDLEGTEIAYSEDDVPHKFPDNWRRESYIINELPIFSENDLKTIYQQGRGRKSEALITDCLHNLNTKVTLVTTGPLTNVAKVFERRPELKSKVQEIVMMGGALKVAGNVEEPGCKPGIEWNFYADPQAVKRIFESGIPIRLIPLDLTDRFPVTKEFLAKLQQYFPQSRTCRLAHTLWSLVSGFEYYFWDTVTAAAVIEPEIFTFKEMRLEISTQGNSQGKLSKTYFGGHKMQVATDVQTDKFEALLLEIFRLR